MKYSYHFTAYFNPGKNWTRSFMNWVKQTQVGVEMIFTEDEFAKFRYEMLVDGMELHEIERILYQEPELVL